MATADECPAFTPIYDKTSASYHLWWNDFATGFVSLISNYVAPDEITEMGEFLFGKTPFSVVAHDVLVNQPSFIIVFWLGILISVFSLAAAVVFLFPCTRDWNTKKVSSKCMSITGLVLAIVSLIFIVAGTALYITSDLNQIIEGDQLSRMDSVKSNINTFMGTKNQNGCFSASIFEAVVNQTRDLPNEVIDTFEEETGLQDMAAVNFTALNLALANTVDVAKILADLQNAAAMPKIANDPQAKAQVQKAIDTYNDISAAQNAGLANDILSYQGDVDHLQTEIATVVQREGGSIAIAAKLNVDGISSLVNGCIGPVSNAMEEANTEIAKAANQIGFALNSASAAVNSSWVFARWLLWVPLLFAVLAALVAVGFGSGFFCGMSGAPNKGVGCFLTVFGIVMLALTSVVMVPTIVGMTFGYSTQTSFDPFFYDYNLKGLQSLTLHLPIFKIPTMNNQFVHTTFGEMMVTCKNEDSPFFSAAVSKNSDVINTTMFDLAIDTAALSKQFATGINGSGITAIDEPLQTSINKIFTTINQTLDLSAAATQEPTTIANINAEIDAWKKTLDMGKNVDDWLTAYDADPYYWFKDLSNRTRINVILENMMDYYISTVYNGMHDAGQSIHNYLYKDGESCRNLFRSYADAGDLACKAIAGPVQGMWTAAGLAALFFAPLGLALIFISNAYRNGSHHTSHVHPVAEPSKPHSPAPVAAQPPAPQHHPVAVAAVAHAAVPHHRVEAAPAVPLRHSSRDPWQSDYLGPLGYTPQPTPLFIDPLASPPVPARAPARGYQGSPANGYYPNPGSSTSRH